MNKKYNFYAAITCLMFIGIVMIAVLIIDLILQLTWQLVLGMFLFCAACLPLWFIFGNVLSNYYESEAKRRNRRKLIVIPYTVPTKSEKLIQFSKPSVVPDADLKVYKHKDGNVELRKIITDSGNEADTQIYSIRKTK